MTQCPECQSEHVIKKGPVMRFGELSQRYKCRSCGAPFYYVSFEDMAENETYDAIEHNNPIITNRTWVITSAVNDVGVNRKLLETLKSYCKINSAELLINKIKYDQNGTHEYIWDEELLPYLVDENVDITTGLKLLGGVHVSPAIGNPLSGFEMFCKGKSIIVPHPQLMMKTVAMSHVDPSVIMHTTGAITHATYTPTKQGTKAEYTHSYSALVIEEDAEINGFHIRVLNSDESGSFYDLDKFYDGRRVAHNQEIDAIAAGDEHVIHGDPAVINATFTGIDSIVNVLKPKVLIRHDVLDFYSGSSHHAKNVFTQYAKFISGTNDSAKELKLTVEHIINTTPKYARSKIISSNHHEHLTRWLQECNPKNEPWNALLYHELMYLMLKDTKMGVAGAEYPNSFELWARHNYNLPNVDFIGSMESFKIHGIEMAFHGDKGTNGSRGSAVQFSKLGTKSIVGHSHSASIVGGCYQIGCSSYLKLEYNNGPSSWSHTHCIIHKNGKRQMIFVIKGKWRR